jgi:tellurite resistance protein TerC
VRIGRLTLGLALLVAGIAMLVLPGPGIVAIALGLALLAAEFRWARRILLQLRRSYRKVIPRRSHRKNDAHRATTEHQ